MYPYFDISGVSTERLLHEWKWLVLGDCNVVAVSPVGDLFLEDGESRVHWLDVARGTISAIASSALEFREMTKNDANRNRWFMEELAAVAQRKGFRPGKGQCLAYKIPIVFKESTTAPENMYVADLYEYVSFMGDIHRQISDVPDGGKVRIKIEPDPKRLQNTQE